MVFEDDAIVKDWDVFDIEYVPPNLRYREADKEGITHYLKPLTKNTRPINLLITGQSGVGKTAIIKTVRKDVNTYFQEKNKLPPVIYADCSIHTTEYKLIKELYSQLDPIDAQKPQRNSAEYLYDNFTDALENTNRVITIILDEIDKYIQNPRNFNKFRLLRKIHRRPKLDKKPRMSIIYITNKPGIFDRLEPDISSAMNLAPPIVIEPYNPVELTDILYDRVKKALTTEALNKDTITKGMINYLSVQLKDDHCDVRKALTLLELAIHEIIFKNEEKLTEDIINRMKNKVHTENLEKLVERLSPIHYQLIIQCLRKNAMKIGLYHLTPNGWQETVDNYDLYLSLCKRVHEKPVTRRMHLIYLNELKNYEIVESTSLISKGRGKGLAIKWHLLNEKVALQATQKRLKETYYNLSFDTDGKPQING